MAVWVTLHVYRLELSIRFLFMLINAKVEISAVNAWSAAALLVPLFKTGAEEQVGKEGCMHPAKGQMHGHSATLSFQQLCSWAPPHSANCNGGKKNPPVPVAGRLVRHVLWREVLRGGFSTFRQVIFGNKIQGGLFLTITLYRGLYL
jgi:hypothetical protein